MSMDTRTLIEASATVVTVLTLKPGNVYMRLEDSSGYDEDKIKYGIVQQVLHNGTDAVITALEYWRPRYGGDIKADTKVFSNDQELKLFHADPQSFKEHLKVLQAAQENSILIKKRELQALEDTQVYINELFSNQLELSAPITNVTMIED